MPKPAKNASGPMRPTSLSLTDDMSATALRISTEDGAKRPSVADGMQWAIEAVKLLTKEQRAWLTRRDDAPAALEDAVRQAMTAAPPSLSSMTVEQLHELREAISKELRETYRASATRTQDGKRKQQEATR